MRRHLGRSYAVSKTRALRKHTVEVRLIPQNFREVFQGVFLWEFLLDGRCNGGA